MSESVSAESLMCTTNESGQPEVMRQRPQPSSAWSAMSEAVRGRTWTEFCNPTESAYDEFSPNGKR
jgi:hypothetical protein